MAYRDSQKSLSERHEMGHVPEKTGSQFTSLPLGSNSGLIWRMSKSQHLGWVPDSWVMKVFSVWELCCVSTHLKAQITYLPTQLPSSLPLCTFSLWASSFSSDLSLALEYCSPMPCKPLLVLDGYLV